MKINIIVTIHLTGYLSYKSFSFMATTKSFSADGPTGGEIRTNPNEVKANIVALKHCEHTTVKSTHTDLC